MKGNVDLNFNSKFFMQQKVVWISEKKMMVLKDLMEKYLKKKQLSFKKLLHWTESWNYYLR